MIQWASFAHAQQILAAPRRRKCLPWFQVHLVPPIQPVLRLKWDVRPPPFLPYFLSSVAAMAQGSPFDTGFNAIQALFTGTLRRLQACRHFIAATASPTVNRREEGARRCRRRNRHCVLAVNVLSWLWGV